MKHSPWLPQDTKSLRSCYGNWAKMLLKVILESNVTLNITRSSDSFSTVPPIVNGDDWGCIMRDLETIIVLVLLEFNFIPQRSHHSLTQPRSRIRTLQLQRWRLGMAQQPSTWNHQHNRSAYFPKWKKAPKCTGGAITGPKQCPPNTTLTSFLLQPSTMTYCDRFDRNCANIDKTEPPIPTERL